MEGSEVLIICMGWKFSLENEIVLVIPLGSGHSGSGFANDKHPRVKKELTECNVTVPSICR